MDKQELLECIVGYLPYNVKAQLYFNGKKQHQVVNSNKTLCLRTVAFYIENYDHIGFKIILHPLSDLTKPCLEGGKIPIDLFDVYEEDNFEYTDIKTYHEIENIAKHGIIHDVKWLPYGVVEQLLKWHFDVFGLIEKRYAIDINTLNSSKVE